MIGRKTCRRVARVLLLKLSDRVDVAESYLMVAGVVRFHAPVKEAKRVLNSIEP